MKDGGLRTIFRVQFDKWQWTSIETAGTASGVPDSEFCTTEGIQGWIEFKQTSIFAVNIRPFQMAWLMKRCRYGGNAWIAVRRVPTAKKWNGRDELWLMKGDQAQALLEDGLENIKGWCWGGGPKNWNFPEIHNILQGLVS